MKQTLSRETTCFRALYQMLHEPQCACPEDMLQVRLVPFVSFKYSGVWEIEWNDCRIQVIFLFSNQQGWRTLTFRASFNLQRHAQTLGECWLQCS